MKAPDRLLALAGRTILAATLAVVAGIGSMPGSAQEPAGGRAAPAAGAPRADKGSVRPGTLRMARRLEQLIDALEPMDNMYCNTQRAALQKKAMQQAATPEERMRASAHLADELLKAGRTQEAIDLVEPLLRQAESGTPGAPPVVEALRFLGLCQLRLGEQENCIANHNIDSCLLPLRGGGIHTVQRGSRAAVETFTKLLRSKPDDLSARWLLNVAAMTLGDYPERVPPAWRIPPEVFDSDADIKRFIDAAPRLGLSLRGHHAGGSVMEDFDGDGLLDLMVSSVGLRDQLRLFRNNGDGTFTERTEAAGLTGEVGGLNLVHADYDNDGRPDVLVLRGAWWKKGGRFPNSLLRNNGDGTFEDVTEEAGLLSFHPTQTAAWADYDNDGFLDLFVGNESERGDPHPYELFHSNRDGTFSNRSVDLGDPDLGYVKGVAWGDFNNDGRPDLYVSVLHGDNILFRNDGRRDPPGTDGADWRFTNVSRQAGTLEPRESFPTWFWDYDNDGWLDLFVGGFSMQEVGDIAAIYLGKPSRAERARLYRNNHDGTFTDVSRAVHLDRLALTMAGNFGDLDNDGWVDCYFGTGEPSLAAIVPNRMFRNEGGRVFQDITTSGGFGNIQKGHAISFGDLDNDGDQDIYEVMGGAYEGDVAQNVLFVNPGHGNHWVTLRLEGRRSNRSAIGARIKVCSGAAPARRCVYSTVGSGGSFGASSLQQEIGLGGAQHIDLIEVGWPTTGLTQTFRDVAVDRIYRLIEGEAALRPVEAKKFAL